eukprot:gene14761-17441_t
MPADGDDDAKFEQSVLHSLEDSLEYWQARRALKEAIFSLEPPDPFVLQEEIVKSKYAVEEVEAAIPAILEKLGLATGIRNTVFAFQERRQTSGGAAAATTPAATPAGELPGGHEPQPGKAVVGMSSPADDVHAYQQTRAGKAHLPHTAITIAPSCSLLKVAVKAPSIEWLRKYFSELNTSVRQVDGNQLTAMKEARQLWQKRVAEQMNLLSSKAGVVLASRQPRPGRGVEPLSAGTAAERIGEDKGPEELKALEQVVYNAADLFQAPNGESMPVGSRGGESMPVGLRGGESMPVGLRGGESMPVGSRGGESMPVGLRGGESMP